MNTTENLTSPELVFLPKDEEPCDECDKKPEVKVAFPLYTQDEFRKVLDLLQKYKMNPQELEYVYNFYNRVFKTNKKPGCAKCLRNMNKHLTNRYNQDYS